MTQTDRGHFETARQKFTCYKRQKFTSRCKITQDNGKIVGMIIASI